MTQGLELRGAVLGKGYRLGRRLATDDTSAYEATHERIPGRFIIRLFPPETLSQPESSSRIQRGARVASLLRDPHAVQVLDCNASGEMPAFVVVERVPGRSLAEVMAEVIADAGMLPLPRVVEIVDALAVALAAGHQIGLVHGDIRPAHVFLPTSGQPAARLSGFGWAKELRAAARLPSPSGYLAPEQQFGKVLTLDERTDQFGLAALAYDMLAGCLPFSEESTDLADMLSSGQKIPPALADLVPGLPPALDEVLRRALTASPSDRFNTVVELADRFRDAAAAPSAVGRTDSEKIRAEEHPVREVRAGGFRAAGATPGRPSNDVTEELDLAALSPLSEAERATLEDGDELEETTAEIGAAPERPAEDLDGDDADLVLGTASASSSPRSTAASAAPSDEAKTQIVRSPFFEEDSSESDPMTESRIDVPVTTPRRGIPVGRPPVVVGASVPGSGKVVGGRLGTGRVRGHLQKTNPGIGPEMLPGYDEGADGERPAWLNLSKNRWALPALGAVLLLAAIFALRALVSPKHEDTVTAAAPPTAPVAPVAPVAAVAAVAAVAPAPARTVETAPPVSPPVSTAISEQPAAAQSRTPHPAVVAPHDRGPIVARVDPLPGAAARPAAPTEVGRVPPLAPGGSPPQPPAVTTMARRPPARVATPARSASSSAPGTSTAVAKNKPADEADDECSIRISSRPWAEVWLDGKNTGRKTPIDKMKVPCGTRKLELKRPDKDIEQMEMMEVLPGKPYRGSYELE